MRKQFHLHQIQVLCGASRVDFVRDDLVNVFTPHKLLGEGRFQVLHFLLGLGGAVEKGLKQTRSKTLLGRRNDLFLGCSGCFAQFSQGRVFLYAQLAINK